MTLPHLRPPPGWYWFDIDYRLDDGSQWAVKIMAQSSEDAETRLRCIQERGTISGQILEEIPADEFGHDTTSELCPCMPLVRDDVIIHNSYDGRELGEVCSKALDLIGSALSQHSHTWTPDERFAYDHAMHVLQMHYPEIVKDRDGDHDKR